jgi:flagellin-like protein
MKKGISPVIGTVLLIMLVFVAGGLVYGWTRYTLKKSQEQFPVECGELEFVVADFCYDLISVENIETRTTEQETRIRFNGRNDVFNSLIEGFLFSIDWGGTIISVPTMPYSEIEGGEAKTLFTNIIENVDNVKEIKIIPKIKKDNEIILCEVNGKIVVGGLEQC